MSIFIMKFDKIDKSILKVSHNLEDKNYTLNNCNNSLIVKYPNSTLSSEQSYILSNFNYVYLCFSNKKAHPREDPFIKINNKIPHYPRKIYSIVLIFLSMSLIR